MFIFLLIKGVQKLLELFVAKLWRNLVKKLLGSRISRQDVVVLIYFSKLFFLFFIHLVVFLVLCFGIVRGKNIAHTKSETSHTKWTTAQK